MGLISGIAASLEEIGEITLAATLRITTSPPSPGNHQQDYFMLSGSRVEKKCRADIQVVAEIMLEKRDGFSDSMRYKWIQVSAFGY